jgi:hypothetical protein
MRAWQMTVAVACRVLAVIWSWLLRRGGMLQAISRKRILLLIAHPDDEAMFFGPTVLAVTRPELRNDVRILCLSTGTLNKLKDQLDHSDTHRKCRWLGRNTK